MKSQFPQMKQNSALPVFFHPLPFFKHAGECSFASKFSDVTSINSGIYQLQAELQIYFLKPTTYPFCQEITTYLCHASLLPKQIFVWKNFLHLQFLNILFSLKSLHFKSKITCIRKISIAMLFKFWMLIYCTL